MNKYELHKREVENLIAASDGYYHNLQVCELIDADFEKQYGVFMVLREKYLWKVAVDFSKDDPSIIFMEEIGGPVLPSQLNQRVLQEIVEGNLARKKITRTRVKIYQELNRYGTCFAVFCDAEWSFDEIPGADRYKAYGVTGRQMRDSHYLGELGITPEYMEREGELFRHVGTDAAMRAHPMLFYGLKALYGEDLGILPSSDNKIIFGQITRDWEVDE